MFLPMPAASPRRLPLVGWRAAYPPGLSGIAILAAGVVLLSARGGRALEQMDRRAVAFALVAALTICAYSVIGSAGVRLSHNPGSYVLRLFVGNAMLLVPYGLTALRALARGESYRSVDTTVL